MNIMNTLSPLEFELVDSHLEASSMSSISRLVVATGGLWCNHDA